MKRILWIIVYILSVFLFLQQTEVFAFSLEEGKNNADILPATHGLEVGKSNTVFDGEKALASYFRDIYSLEYWMHGVIYDENYFSKYEEIHFDDIESYAKEDRLFRKLDTPYNSSIGWINESNVSEVLQPQKIFYRVPFSYVENAKISNYRSYQGTYISFIECYSDFGYDCELLFIPAEVAYTVYFVDEAGKEIHAPIIKYAYNTFAVEESPMDIKGYAPLYPDEKSIKTIYHERDLAFHMTDVTAGIAGNSFVFLYEKSEEEVDFTVQMLDSKKRPILDFDREAIRISAIGILGEEVDLNNFAKDIQGYSVAHFLENEGFILTEENNTFYILYEPEEREIKLILVGENLQPILDINGKDIIFYATELVGESYSYEERKEHLPNGYVFLHTEPGSLYINPYADVHEIQIVCRKKQEILYYIYHVDENHIRIHNSSIDIYMGEEGDVISVRLDMQKSMEGYAAVGVYPAEGKITLTKGKENSMCIMYKKAILSTPDDEREEDNGSENAGVSQPAKKQKEAIIGNVEIMKDSIVSYQFASMKSGIARWIFQSTIQCIFPN